MEVQAFVSKNDRAEKAGSQKRSALSAVVGCRGSPIWYYNTVTRKPRRVNPLPHLFVSLCGPSASKRLRAWFWHDLRYFCPSLKKKSSKTTLDWPKELR